MLERESYDDGWQVRLPVTGAARLMRLVPAVFLCAWLCGWAFGEYFAGGMLLAGLRDLLAPGLEIAWLPHVRNAAPATAPYVLTFLGLWVAFWTAGGVFAFGAVLGLVFGTPIVRWNAQALDFVMQVGPFSRRRRIALAGIQDVAPGPLGTLTISGSGGKLTLGPFADAADSSQMAGWIQEARQQAERAPERMAAAA